MRRALPILGFLILAASRLAGQSFDAAAADRLAQETLSRWKAPGVAVAVVKDDQVIYLKGFGVRDLATKAPVTPDTLFQIGSTSKAFTTTAMALLADEKKLDWDDPVRKHVDWFRLSDPCADSMVNLRDIVSHRTGLSRHDEIWDYTTLSREEILRRVANVKLTKPIRSAWQYNNMMFMLAGEVVASAAKMPWADFVRTRIFTPLGMRNSVIAQEQWVRSEHATGYRYDDKRDAVEVMPELPYESLAPAGNIKSTARDMAQWLRFQLANGAIDGKRLVSEKALGETKTPQMVEKVDKESDPETNILTYGMAWGIRDYRGDLLVSHGGALNGFRANVALLPNQHAGVVVLGNIGRGAAFTALTWGLVDQLLARGTRDWNSFYLDAQKKARADAETKKAEKEAKRRRDSRPSHDLAAYAGAYENAFYGPVTVTADGDRLTIQYGRLRMPLTHWQYDTFNAVDEVEDMDEDVTFTTDVNGVVNSLTLFGEQFTRRSE